jgi:hypothetical protein
VLVVRVVVLQALVRHQALLAVQELLVKAILAAIVLMVVQVLIKVAVAVVQVLLVILVLALHPEMETVVMD